MKYSPRFWASLMRFIRRWLIRWKAPKLAPDRARQAAKFRECKRRKVSTKAVYKAAQSVLHSQMKREIGR